ncbi:MAG TPA: DUF6029 family protein [Bacteroidia bacterium]|nr:DUF6029 family protein [Bacteroidia bacterium]
MKKKFFSIKNILFPILFCISYSLSAQNNEGQIHGNFEIDAQYYNPDSAIGAPAVPEKILSNGFLNINYTNGNISAGLRYESYLDVMQGFDSRYQGTGIPYRYFEYNVDKLDVTVGSYYEQFGSGLIFRSYEARGLLYDNAMDGIRLRYNPYKGVYIKAIIGKQREFFSEGPGLVRGADGELELNELVGGMAKMKTHIIVGGSFVSKYQVDQDPIYNLPQNVGASAARINIIRKGINLYGEYAYKINDPSTFNHYIYKPGQALFITTSYYKKGFSIMLDGERLDNMDYKSDRTQTGSILDINYLPDLTLQHTEELMTFYPYATQPNGQVSFESEVQYKLKKESLLGGHYGTDLLVNFSGSNGLDTINLNDMSTTRNEYKSNFLSVGKEMFYRDCFASVHHKFSKKFTGTAEYAYQIYNKNVIQGQVGWPMIYANIGVFNGVYKFNSDHALTFDIEHLATKQDMGNWASLLLEFSMGSNWFVSALDEYNYGNSNPAQQIHYFIANAGYMINANRITIGYGKQRAGIFCVGGVCRNVPASNGFTLSVTSSF